MRRSFMHQLLEFFSAQSYDLSLSSTVALSLLKNQNMKNQKPSKKMTILQRLSSLEKSTQSSKQKNSPPSAKSPKKINIIIISAAAYHILFKRNHKNKSYNFFSMSLYDINQILKYIEPCMSIRLMPEIKKTFTQKITLKKVNRLLLVKFKNLFQDFDLNLIEKLLSHKAYNHKIELEKNPRTIKSRIYSMSYHKLIKLKKYLNENLKKDFITVSSIIFIFPVLFATKFNNNLRFCVNYKKLNIITKRNKYPIPLIKKTLTKIIDFKYLTKLNIIVAFNKLRINPNSENLITFIISLNLYKYKILLFELINELVNYQHYMNDVLWNYINDFVQCYLNDILIYSKTRKTHVKHIKTVLKRFREVDLQINITKSEFFVKKTIFLDIIVSINGIRINSKKIQIVIDWVILTNLKKV